MALTPENTAPSERARTIAVVGPTASGKSSLAMALAQKVGGELVSCDSVQVYRGFDIGSAKPSLSEQALVPHHLIDCADWNEPYDARRYRDEAAESVRAIHGRGRTAIVVGGTGLYLRALRFGLVEVPPSDPTMRAELEARNAASLLDELETLDPQGAREIDPDNHVHLVRALEICRLTGEPASKLRAAHQFQKALIPMRIFYLKVEPEVLRDRIAARTQQMLESGLIEEVRGLRDTRIPADCRPMKAVGYAQVNAFLDGGLPEQELYDRIRFATAQYAKRQRTWFAKTEGREDLEDLDTASRLSKVLS